MGKLGIVTERSRLASPQDNGRHERMYSTLKQAREHTFHRALHLALRRRLGLESI